MTRYKPPTKPGAKYITREGELRLKEELNQLWKVERPKVTQQVSDAAALGDRSENAEYIYERSDYVRLIGECATSQRGLRKCKSSPKFRPTRPKLSLAVSSLLQIKKVMNQHTD